MYLIFLLESFKVLLVHPLIFLFFFEIFTKINLKV